MASNKSEKADRIVNRSKIIVRTSIIGIVANALISAFKAIIGFTTGSIAITLDAVNNMADAAASALTIVGTKLAGKEPNRKHPFGYGRIEYLTAGVIAMLILYAGITSLIESIKKIIDPNLSDYSAVALVVIAAAVVAKAVLGRYVTAVGKRVGSDSLVNSGRESTLDSIISAATLVAAGVYIVTGLSLEAYLGAIISVVIIKAGFDMIKETLSKVLGENAEADLSRGIKETVCSFPHVYGAYDLFLNDYGPDAYQGSVHIEVPDTSTADELDELIRNITAAVHAKHDVLLTAIGIYSVNTTDPRAIEARDKVSKIALGHDHVKQIHGFFLNEEKAVMRFDIVVDFDAEDRAAVHDSVLKSVQCEYPDYDVQITLDIDLMES